MVEFLKHGMHYHVAQEMRAAAAAVEDKDDTTATPKNDTARTRMMMMMQPAVLECAFLMADIHAQLAGIQSSGATVAVCLIRVCVIVWVYVRCNSNKQGLAQSSLF